jgi:ATP-dependent helicase/nuclease subunit B
VRAHGPVSFHEAVRRALDDHGELPASTRLGALAAVFEAYDRTLHDLGRVDPEESLAGLEALVARRGEEIREWTFFVDGFLSWTRREREILVALAAAGARLEIALCLEDSSRVPFDPARRTLAQLRGAFDRAGIVEEPPIRLDAPSPETGRFRVAQLRRLERGLYAEAPAEADERAQPGAASEGRAATEMHTAAVVLQAARTPRLEVLLWARTLDRWLRLDPQPCAPQETAVILRDLDVYRDFIREIFPLYGLPVFLDERRGLLAHPRVRFLLEALEVILSGWRRDAVLTFLRNPLLAVPPGELDLLDILSREYGRDFESWYAPAWEAYDPGRRARFRHSGDESPMPEGEGEEPDESEGESEIEEDEELPPEVDDEEGRRRRESLLRTDRLRTRWLLPLRALEEVWRGARPTGPDLVAGLRALSRDLPSAADAREPDPEPEWTAQVESEVEILLDEAASLWEGVAVEPEEFARALRQGCASARVGVTPQRLGQVTVAEVQRSRLHGIRRAIVGGCNDGVFPRTVGEDAILGDRDRRALGAVGLEFGPTAGEKQEEETYFTYVALTRASERLLLTWSRTGEQGEAREPSLLLEEVRRALPDAEAAPPAAEPESMAPSALQTGAELGGRLVVHLAETGIEEVVEPAGKAAQPTPPVAGGAAEDPLLEELYNRVERAAEAEAGAAEAGPGAPAEGPIGAEGPIRESRHRLDRARAALLYRPETRLEDDVVARLFPDETIRAGVSRLLEFARCPYQAFAGRVLKLEPRPQAEVTPLETGTLAHFALESFFRAPSEADPRAIRRRLDEIFRGLAGRDEFRAFFVDEASHYRWGSTLQNLERFLRVELARLAGSPYKPHAQEVAFGPASGNAVEIPLAHGGRLLLVGRIDRLDRREAEEAGGPILGTVVDYKRSAKQGLPGGLERGIDLQLAAYLLFVRERLGWVPAGGFYAPVLVAPKREEELRGDSANPLKVQVHGIYLQEEGTAIDGGTEMLVGLKRAGGQSVSAERMDVLLRRGRRFLAAYADGIRSGWIEARPLEERAGTLPCANCDFAAVCRFQVGRDPVRGEPSEGMTLPPEEAP